MDFPINEPLYSRNTVEFVIWFSHKINGPALRYELGVCIQTGDIVWIAGPFPPGQWPDSVIFDFAMKKELAEGERVEADAGYMGPDLPVRHPNDFGGNEQWKRMKGRARARHEQVNAILKQFNILGQTFRHSKHKHYRVVLAVAAIVQSEIEEGNMVHQVDYHIHRPTGFPPIPHY